jgi:hypothetical protein
MAGEFRCSGLVVTLTVVIVLAIGFGTRSGSTQVRPPQVDLSGKWELDSGGIVQIDHLLATGTVIATFSPPLPCHDDARTRLFSSRLKVVAVAGGGQKLMLEDGAFSACTRDKKLIDSCPGVTAVWSTKFRNATVSPDGNSITGERFHEWLDYEEKDGQYTNCRRNPAKDDWSTWTLTRVCDADAAKRCRSLGRAIRAIESLVPPAVNVTPGEANPLPMPTVSFDPAAWQQKLAQNKPALAAELEALLREFCDDEAARNSINAQRAVLDSLTPGTARTTTDVIAEMTRIAAIDIELKAIATRTCAVSGTPPPAPPAGVCRGVPAKQPGDNAEIDKAIDQIRKSMEKAIKMAEQYEREKGSGPGTTAGQYADYYRTEAAKWRKLLGYWQNIRAATCVPREVIDLLRAVRDGRTDMCTRLCERTADWIAKMYPGPQGETQKHTFFIVCSGNCPE